MIFILVHLFDDVQVSLLTLLELTWPVIFMVLVDVEVDHRELLVKLTGVHVKAWYDIVVELGTVLRHVQPFVGPASTICFSDGFSKGHNFELVGEIRR